MRRLAVVVLLLAGCGSARPATPPRAAAPQTAAVLDVGATTAPLAVDLGNPADTVRVDFKHPPKAGLLFDVDTGRVLWRRRPTLRHPIASLTKMMTALVVDDRLPFTRELRVTREALDTTGSEVGLFKKGMRLPVRTLLFGLLLPSGNDAARVLAQGAGHGSIRRFVTMMNDEAATLGLRCSHFNTPSGLEDAHNFSCAADLAAMAREILRRPRLARIVATRAKVLRYPGKGHKLYLYNHNPLLLEGFRGTTGVKTGYTDAAGLCFVATARRGAIKLGAVLIDSPDIEKQARRLLEAGFRAELR